MVTTKKITWLAGLLEGEGAFYLRETKSLRIVLDMTDYDVVQRAAKIMGANAMGPYAHHSKGKRDKDTYRAIVGREIAAGWMMTLVGLMGDRRREKIESAILSWRKHVRPPIGFQIPENLAKAMTGRLKASGKML